MLQEGKRYSLNELLNKVNEASEFKPIKGDGVDKKEKQNNKKSVDDIIKDVENSVKSSKTNKKRNTNPELEKDYNKTTLDYDYDYEPSKEYKERVKANAHGYPSKYNEEHSDLDKSTTEGNKKFYKERSEINKEMNKNETDHAHAGLKNNKLPRNNFEKNTLFGESKMKRLKFSNTIFLSEEDMKKRIPEEYKIDGNHFIMKDKADNEYLIECVKDENINTFIHTNVISMRNKKKLVEEFNTIKRLNSYNSCDYFKKNKNQMNENKEMSIMINKVKSLKK